MKEMGQKKKAIYSEEFQAMLDRLEEEDYAESRSMSGGQMCMRKSRLCMEQVKALEKHFEMENKLQPERKLMIAEEVGLEPRQVAIWFQNRRARWKTKQLEREYCKLRASYDALKHDYGSLEQEKLALLSQLKGLKARIAAKALENSSDNLSTRAPLSVSSSSSSSRWTFDPFPFATSSMVDGFQPCKAYQSHQITRVEEVGMFSNYEEPCNIFSVDQAPSLHWYPGDHSS
ncbi:hypothetical protein Cgig2_011707 [Carnegiea gigantea]|uniref:Homeobox-leucine zipper protein n=1 Tax=Carnegiea gigantea TaxID=171969 RepID=A0A9Q1JXA8_9CARY|nr:hypothetical protein Cgig2_011707 [Carnegiea gigantea]